MANNNEVTFDPQNAQGETIKLGSDVELVRDDSTGNLKIAASSGDVDLDNNNLTNAASVSTDELLNETGFAVDAGQALQGQVDRASWGQTQLPTTNWTKYTDSSPLFEPSDVSSSTTFCADPFALTHEGDLYLIYEQDTGDATPDIGISESPDGKTDWTHHSQVIADDTKAQPFPHTVLYRGNYYLVTNQAAAGRVQLWQTSYSDFPTGWSEVWDKQIASGTAGAWDEAIKDAGMVIHDGMFWLIYAGGAGGGNYGHIGAKYTAASDIETPTFRDAEWNGMEIGDNIQGFAPVQYGNTIQFHVNARSLTDNLRLLTANTINRSEIDLYQHPDPVLTTGSVWDSSDVHHHYAVRVGDSWHLYYDGQDNNSSWKLGLATLDAEVTA